MNQELQGLLACPFCGQAGKAIIGPIRDGAAVCCSNFKCLGQVQAFNPNAREKAIAAWNQRASLTAKDAEREIMVAALLDIAKTSRDEGGCFYNNRISISRARDTLKEIGIDWLNPARALHENPESKA